jgi:membrane-bound lytic murein transglycosylase MltF
MGVRIFSLFFFITAMMIGFCPGLRSETIPEQGKQIRDELMDSAQLITDFLEVSRDDLPTMITRKKIRILTTATYGNYFVSEGQAYGFEYSQMEEYRKYLNKNIKKKEDRLDFIYLPVPYDLLNSALKNGYGDIIAANMTILPEREGEATFTDPYLWGLKEVVVTKAAAGPVTSVDDLSGRTVYVREGSSYQISLGKVNERLRDRNLPPVKLQLLPGVISTGDILDMISSGIVEMTVADSHIASLAAKVLPNLAISPVSINDDVRCGWLVRKNNPLLLKSLNGFIKTVKKGTMMGNMLFDRYYIKNPWVREAVKNRHADKLGTYETLFRKFGQQYIIDWLLIAAQAYQESGFDPDARSAAGAVGLMQIKPDTAKGIGFDNIAQPEDNVHAAVKYLSWIMDKYFPEKTISDDDRVRFALAAYNAGPANIKKARDRAAALGFDPNRWFGNAEMGVMKTVGMEPVNYVRNINKEYLAFLISSIVQDFKQQKLQEMKE